MYGGVKVISLTGQKRSGKDTVASLFMLHNHNIRKYAFADPVRDAAKAFFGWSDVMFTDEYKEQVDEFWGISPRQALQYLGTEVGRIGVAKQFPIFEIRTGDTIWIKRFRKFLNENTDADAVVISDTRFMNELNYVKEVKMSMGFPVITIGITRPGTVVDGHASETEVQKCVDNSAYNIVNDGTIDKLDKAVQAIMLEHDITIKE